jgi:hypothetical protein
MVGKVRPDQPAEDSKARILFFFAAVLRWHRHQMDAGKNSSLKLEFWDHEKQLLIRQIG